MFKKILAFSLLPLIIIGCTQTSNSSMEPKGKLTRVEGWPNIDQDATYKTPTALAVDSHNHVFVFQRAGRPRVEPLPREPIPQDTVLMLDGETGKLLASWGSDAVIMPHGLNVDADDNVWLTDVGSHQIHKFSHDGELLLTLGEFFVGKTDKTHFGQPADLAFYKNRIFVADGYTNTRVVVLDLQGKYQYEWGEAGDAAGQFHLPHGINLDSKGRVYVADRNNSRLQIFSNSGKFIEQWERERVGRPLAVDITDSGDVIILDGGDQPDNTRSRLLRFSSKGELLEAVDTRLDDRKPLGHDVDIAPDGSIYFVDPYGNRIGKFEIK